MAISRILGSIVLTIASGFASAGAPTVDSPLSQLSITDRGELTMSGDDFSYIPWSSDSNPGKVHVIQYFGANMGDRDVFKPFTDLIETSFEPNAVHVTTVLNLDAAMWGTTGFVLSELEKNKRVYPTATMVLDDEGAGVTEWDLGEDGTGLIVMDDKGIVKYFTRQSISDANLATVIELVRSNIGN